MIKTRVRAVLQRIQRRAAVATAVPLLVLGTATAGALLASPGIAAATSGVPSTCGYPYSCMYAYTYYGGLEGAIQSTNWYWDWPTTYTYCGNSGTWNDCADSLANNEVYNNYFWVNINCQTGRTSSIWLYPNTQDPTLGRWATAISSNSYGYVGGCAGVGT